jgi:hypothetical protein
MKKKGYGARDAISHRKYSRKVSIGRFKRTGQFSYRKDGSGHLAGEEWGRKKAIDPHSRITKYSKNSPSFDEGVYTYKARERALKSKQDE